MLGVRLAFFRGWVGYLILSVLALPASAPLGEDAERAGGDASPANARGAGACGSSPRALGPLGPTDPKGFRRGHPITRSGPAEG